MLIFGKGVPSDDAKVFLRFRFWSFLRGDYGAAPCLVRVDTEKLLPFLARVKVEIMPADDGFRIARLQGGVADRSVGGDVVGNE